jgi:hypothetical protein
MDEKLTDRNRLINIAADLAAMRGFLSPYPEDHPRGISKRLLDIAAHQESVLRDWAYEVGQIARRMK